MTHAVVRLDRTAPRRRDAGFTLAEMLVSLFLFGLISALIAAVVDLVTKLDGSVRKRGEAVDQIVSAQTLLRGRIEQIRPTIDIHGLGDTIAMIGTAAQFDFTAPGFAANGHHGTQLLRLALTNQQRLMLYTAPLLAGYDMRAASVEGWDAVPLLDKAQSLQISYFGTDRLTGRDVWQDNWSARAQPPKLVRIRVGFAAGDPRRWPILMVRPLSGTRLVCQDGRRSADCGEPK